MNDIDRIYDADVYGPDGAKIGSAAQIYLDNDSGKPEWVAVRTGLFGKRESFVPLAQATLSGDRLDVPFGKDKVKDAPNIDTDGALSPAQEDELYSYYDMSSVDGRESASDDATGTGVDGNRSDLAANDGAMTRSEERLRTGTRTEQAGTARLRKHVVTEQQQVTVPVTREEIRVEREPITDANVGDATSGPDISEDEHRVTLHAERPVVTTETVPMERVRLGTETVTDTETVTGQVRKEQIDTDLPETNPRRS